MFITIDGDDIGQMITRYYLCNDVDSLAKLNKRMIETTRSISIYLHSVGFEIIFCGADGVAGHSEDPLTGVDRIFKEISAIGSGFVTFSAGVGDTLRDSYVALMAAKSHGKAQVYLYRNLERECFG